jgi:hypothetical protein
VDRIRDTWRIVEGADRGRATVRIAAGITSGLRGAAWGTAGTIVFGTNDATGLQRVSASAT